MLRAVGAAAGLRWRKRIVRASVSVSVSGPKRCASARAKVYRIESFDVVGVVVGPSFPAR